jgi:hypothetical protein
MGRINDAEDANMEQSYGVYAQGGNSSSATK